MQMIVGHFCEVKNIDLPTVMTSSFHLTLHKPWIKILIIFQYIKSRTHAHTLNIQRILSNFHAPVQTLSASTVSFSSDGWSGGKAQFSWRRRLNLTVFYLLFTRSIPCILPWAFPRRHCPACSMLNMEVSESDSCRAKFSQNGNRGC